MTPEESYNEALREWGMQDIPLAAPTPSELTPENCPCVYCAGNRRYAEEEKQRATRQG